MKLGDILAQWIRTGVQPSEPDLQMVAQILNSVQLNNIPAVGWPSLNEINFKDIQLGAGTVALLAAANVFTADQSVLGLGAELVANGGFETLNGATDVWTQWAEGFGDGNVEDELTIVHGGAHACKLTSVSAWNGNITGTVAVSAGNYTATYWVKGDGVHSLYVQIFDVDHATELGNRSDVLPTSYTQHTIHFTVPSGCTYIYINFYSWQAGTVSYVDDVSVKDDATNTEQLVNGGFESLTPPNYTGWWYNEEDGDISDEKVIVHGGSHAVKVMCGASLSTPFIINSPSITTIAGHQYEVSIWLRGDGTHALQWHAVSQPSWLPLNSPVVGTTGTTYVKSTAVITADDTGIVLVIAPPGINGAYGYADDVTIKEIIGGLTLGDLIGAGDRIVRADANGVLSAAGTDLAVADGGTGASTAADARTNLGLPDSTYTPTLTNTTNISASTVNGVFQYMKVGNTVLVSGSARCTPTAGGAILLGISLPVASNFALTTDGSGVANSSTVVASLYTDATNDRMSLSATAPNTAEIWWRIMFQYQII